MFESRAGRVWMGLQGEAGKPCGNRVDLICPINRKAGALSDATPISDPPPTIDPAPIQLMGYQLRDVDSIERSTSRDTGRTRGTREPEREIDAIFEGAKRRGT